MVYCWIFTRIRRSALLLPCEALVKPEELGIPMGAC